jgi:hypothetical protein
MVRTLTKLPEAFPSEGRFGIGALVHLPRHPSQVQVEVPNRINSESAMRLSVRVCASILNRKG